MAIEQYKLQLNTPLLTVWDFISIPENWLPLLPDFIRLSQLSLTTYHVFLYLKLGPIDREVQLEFNIQLNKQTHSVDFTFHSTTGKVTGYGFLKADAPTTTTTNLTLAIEVKLSGKTGLLFKPALTSLKTSWSQETLNKLALLLNESEN
ncbi:hypothetical protein [Carnobacterium maltaromaticum]|uniref:hypothetical protein n=1 Tax=Carnobacterium maltaromaticum TaxID=2751 RepID=UPI00295F0D38|nr:hypothetical protein [Carnobacterium maltaromaticum]